MYIGTSLLVAFYVPEKLTQKVNNLISNADKLCLSAISKIEFLSALNKKVRMGFFTREEVNIAYIEFDKHILRGIYRHINVDENHFKRASELLLQTNAALRILDAIHLGIANIEGFEIASNDKTLLKAAKDFNIQTTEI